MAIALLVAGTAVLVAGWGINAIAAPLGKPSIEASSSGAHLNATFLLVAPSQNQVVLNATPCYQLQVATQVCNVSFATTILPNGTCHNTSNIGSFGGVTYPFTGKFYLVSAEPSLPTLIRACGPSSLSAPVFHLIFHMVQQSGTVTAKITLRA